MDDTLISDEYRALLVEKHDKRPWGGTGKTWVPALIPILRKLRNVSIVLDYGCGRGTLKPALEEALPDIRVEEYDPGVRGKDLPPAVADYVVCTDVLEHIEPDRIDEVLKHIKFLAIHGVFLVIVCTPSKSSLPDGRNTHILIQPPAWWVSKLAEHFPNMFFTWHEHTDCRIVVSGNYAIA